MSSDQEDNTLTTLTPVLCKPKGQEKTLCIKWVAVKFYLAHTHRHTISDMLFTILQYAAHARVRKSDKEQQHNPMRVKSTLVLCNNCN
jgi:hypothetical protein